tara:strand:- start:83 stop:397 length:315 start_codon:yes stop_codon:yes gene_type:complete
MAPAKAELGMINSTPERKNMRSAKKVKSRLSAAWEVFIDWLYATIVLLGVAGILMIGAVSIASMANSLRMTGYLDAVFGMYALIAAYILIWLPVSALVYYYKQE